MDSKNIPEQREDELNNTKNPMQILEEALTLCKFGKFHLRLLAATFCSTVALTLVTTTTSYILPIAECDLEMDVIDKGILGAMAFLGQILMSFFAGFLTDAFGRKIILVGGNAIMFVGTVIEGSSQTYLMLIFTKLIQGIAVSLSFSAVTTNLTESCHLRVRDRLLLIWSSFVAVGLIFAALFAWAILPNELNYSVWPEHFEIHSWNIYIYACSIWSFLAFVLYLSLPESPKYLLSQGREEEALQVLKIIYSENSGENKDTFPILSFNTSGTLKPTNEISLKKKIVNGLFETKELFRKPLLNQLLLFSFICFVAMTVFSALILWFPQISTIIESYYTEHGKSASFCVMINEYTQDQDTLDIVANGTESHMCVPDISGGETYINGVILGSAAIVAVGIIGFLVDFFGQKLLMAILAILSTICLIVLNWTNASIQIAILISCTCALLQTVLSLQQNIFTRYFPTTLRALATSIIIMMSRIGSLIGNISFPILLKMGCMVPFASSAVIVLCIAVLVYFLPNVAKDNKTTGDK